MRDPHVHAEKCPVPGFGHAAMRELILEATGLAGDLPATVGTGCGRRRPIAITSMVPEQVTCLACREYAIGQLRETIESATFWLTVLPDGPWLTAEKQAVIASEVRENRALLARYEASASNGCE